jgi:AMP-polyphosphate phosphotransferase
LHTHVFLPRTVLENEYPSYWRYWQKLPPAGRIGCFLGAWPMQAVRERLSKSGSPDILSRRIRHIRALEKTLADNGTEVLKLWLHLPREQVKQQLKKAKKDPVSEPYIRQEDWEVYEHYDESLLIAERLVKETGNQRLPWHIIESTDKRFRNHCVAQHVIDHLQVLNRLPDGTKRSAKANSSTPAGVGALTKVDLSATLEKAEYKKELKCLQSDLNKLVVQARDKFSTVVVFEGWDAAGKGGAIRRITKALFAEDYRVIPIAAPSQEEHRYHYLWRFWQRLPRRGKLAFFDRSWYGRVLVERVEGYATDEQWQRAYYEINDFEDQLVSHDMLLCKFWLHIDPDEQLNRFQQRELLAYKNHKITEEDYRNREKWPAYTQAVNDMITQTSTSQSPWNLIPANDKRWARIQVLKTLVKALKDKLNQCE